MTALLAVLGGIEPYQWVIEGWTPLGGLSSPLILPGVGNTILHPLGYRFQRIDKQSDKFGRERSTTLKLITNSLISYIFQSCQRQTLENVFVGPLRTQ